MILRQAERLVNVCVAVFCAVLPAAGISDPNACCSRFPCPRETGEVDASAARELLNTMRHFDDHKGRISNLGNKRRRVQSGLGSG